MSLNAAVIMPPLQQCLFDKTLDTFLSDGKVYFWEDENRTVPKNVYQLTGSGPGSYTYTSLGAVLTLSGIGSFIDGSGGNIAVYLWPFTGSPNDNPPSQTVQNYYITVYSSTNVFQFDIPNWPGIEASSAGVNDADTTENILSNSQFSDVSFSSTAISIGTAISYSTTGTNTATQIAPDWYVVTTGTGSFSIYQQQITDDTAPGNPAYAIGITSTGYSQPIQLRQRLTSPRLFAGQYVSGTFIAEATDGGTYTVTMNYTPSITGTIQQICTGSTVPGGFVTIANNPPIQITDPGIGTGYVDITIVIPVSAPVQISCVQLCGVSNNAEVVSYLQQSPQRETDHLFNYYNSLLQFKPIPSYLVGWDFPLNPAQWGASISSVTTGGTNNAFYAWDQTIIFQTVDNSVAVSRDSTHKGIKLTANTNTQIALIQYLDGGKVTDILVEAITGLCSNIRLFSSVSKTFTLSLWWSASAPPTMSSYVVANPGVAYGGSMVTTLDANGKPATVAVGWSEIATLNGTSKFTSTTSLANYQINGFIDRAATAYQTGGFFAIVLGTSTLANTNSITIQSVSLNAGSIPTIPAPQTVDQVMRESQYYYRQSFLPGTVAADGVGYNTGETVSMMIGTASTVGLKYSVNFPYYARTNPIVDLYNPKIAGGAGQINNETGGGDFTLSTATQISKNGFYATGTGTAGALSNLIGFHWTADSRIGVTT